MTFLIGSARPRNLLHMAGEADAADPTELAGVAEMGTEAVEAWSLDEERTAADEELLARWDRGRLTPRRITILAVTASVLAIAGAVGVGIHALTQRGSSEPKPVPDQPHSPVVAVRAAAPVPGTAGPSITRTTEPAAIRYALPACYGFDDQPQERPTSVTFQFCADGGAHLNRMSWTSWDAAGADGRGYYTLRTCVPNCASGGEEKFPVYIHATTPAPPVTGSGCPLDMQFYTESPLAVQRLMHAALSGVQNRTPGERDYCRRQGSSR